MSNEPKLCCCHKLWNYLKTLPRSLWEWEKKWDAILAIIALVAFFQIPDWLGRQQNAYNEVRGLADGVEKSFRENSLNQAYWVDIPDTKIAPYTKMRMQLALLVITNNCSLEELKEACEPNPANTNASIIYEHIETDLGTNFLEWNPDNLYLNLWEANYWNAPGKARLREVYLITANYLDVFETCWSNHKDHLISDKDWLDWLQYLKDEAGHPLFQLAIALNGKNYSGEFLKVAKDPQKEIRRIKDIRDRPNIFRQLMNKLEERKNE